MCSFPGRKSGSLSYFAHTYVSGWCAREAPPATLPHFEPFSPQLSGSGVDAKVKLRLARLQLEAQEKERKAEYDLRLQIRRLEMEAEKEIKLGQLEVEASRIFSEHIPIGNPAVSQPVQQKRCLDVSKHIAVATQGQAQQQPSLTRLRPSSSPSIHQDRPSCNSSIHQDRPRLNCNPSIRTGPERTRSVELLSLLLTMGSKKAEAKDDKQVSLEQVNELLSKQKCL